MATWQTRWESAKDFWEAAQLLHDGRHANSSATSAIMAAIAANDAICLRLSGRHPDGQSHTEAVAYLQEACQRSGMAEEGRERCRQLMGVLRHKNAAQYNSGPLTSETIERIMKQVERFMPWAESVLGR
jgi:hypothetical protein